MWVLQIREQLVVPLEVRDELIRGFVRQSESASRPNLPPQCRHAWATFVPPITKLTD